MAEKGGLCREVKAICGANRHRACGHDRNARRGYVSSMRPAILDPLFAPLTRLAGVGPKLGELFDTLVARGDGSARVIDLLLHLPVDVVDRSLSPAIAAAPSTKASTNNLKSMNPIGAYSRGISCRREHLVQRTFILSGGEAVTCTPNGFDQPVMS